MTPDELRTLLQQAMEMHHEGVKVTISIQMYVTVKAELVNGDCR
jgi:hypothetical protein